MTDNSKYAIARRECAPTDMSVVIFIPKKLKRGNPKKLKLLEHVFVNAWKMAKKSEYWNAMTINGLATESVLGAPPGIITDLIEGGAEAASISGNGPAIAAGGEKGKHAKCQKSVCANGRQNHSICVQQQKGRKL